jgi:secondary thiamine-phosphate synthase enzyme
MSRIAIKTRQKRQVIDLTDRINEVIRQQNVSDGLCHVFVLHTTAAISVADLDPGTDLDYLEALAALIPDLDYRHPHDPEHTPDHILAMLIGPSLSIPVEARQLVLGTWQRVILLEFDGPRERQLVLSFLK